MNATKTFILLKTLSKKELGDLKLLVKNNKRKSLDNLLELCNKTLKLKRNTNVKSFFELYFKKPYSKKEDNLLRNELRLLNNIIEQFIVDLQMAKEIKENEYSRKKYYLNFLLEQESYELLTKELNKIFKQIEANEDYNYFYDFFFIWTKLHSKNLKMESKYFLDTKESFEKLFSFWKQEVGIKTKKLEIFKSFINRASFMVSRELNFEETTEKIEFRNAKDNIYLSFLENKAKSYNTKGSEKIQFLLEMESQLENLKAKDLNVEQEKFTLLQNLGVEYMIKSNYIEANEYFKKSLNLSSKVKNDYLIKGIFNYVSTLIKLQDFEKAIDLFTEYETKIKASNVKDLFYCIIAMSFILSKKIEKAEAVNRIIDSNKSVGNYLYSRCNLAIIFFENNEKELALNELSNIVQSVNYHKNQDIAYKDFTLFFKSFIQFTYTKSLIKENQLKLKKIHNTIQENFKKTTISYGSDSLHLLWLNKNLEKVITS